MNGNEATTALQRLGLTEYEAKCFVALAHFPQGTARDVSNVTNVPRSRMYGALDRLARKGLVQVQRAEPKVFQAVSVDTALRILRNEYDSYFDAVERSLREIEPVYKEVERGVWALENYNGVTEQTLSLIEQAEDEIVLILVHESVFDEDVLHQLRDALERGVSVLVSTESETIERRMREEIPDAVLFDSAMLAKLDDTAEQQALGRLVMTDREGILVSAVWDETFPGYPEETAMWSSGVDHGFALFVREMLRDEIEQASVR
ncbi:TrmB family transcriptional regulator [Halegenticoccus tardaugens]|uniref:TrmB family transcriptional regulator n=1 Tax=Halegenticoccus tardaugens TaxID=2071624 RepID=UPI00100A4994|nr:helix-turn-helix domain-containing protein [Halegenticoccus tardaugens]